MDQNEKLQKLMEKKQKIQKQLNAIMARENKQKRKDDTRKKILIGSVVLAESKINEKTAEWLQKILDKRITKDADRKLFDLPVKETLESMMEKVTDENRHPEVSTGNPVGNEKL